MNEYDALRLENQLCFPLYVCSKEVVRKYKPYLDELDLTYTQYITMMALWEKQTANVKELGRCLYLDSGTLTPLLKKLETKGYIRRERSREDERNLMVTVTSRGMELQERALQVPEKVGACIPLSGEEAMQLYQLLYKVLGAFEENE